MTHGITPAHLARATLEAVAHQIADVFAAMGADGGHPLSDLRSDGGASGNAFMMQLQADLLGRPVLRAEVEEVGALGVAAMAFVALGVKRPAQREQATVFAPAQPAQSRDAARQCWARAVARARS